jgi:hypothetical protein
MSVELRVADGARLEAIVADRNSPRKYVRRARVALLPADGAGTNEIMGRSGKNKSAAWR